MIPGAQVFRATKVLRTRSRCVGPRSPAGRHALRAPERRARGGRIARRCADVAALSCLRCPPGSHTEIAPRDPRCRIREPTSGLEPLTCSLRVIIHVLQGVCTGLQIPHTQAGFSSPACYVLHRIALPVVSEWCQTGTSTAERGISSAPLLWSRLLMPSISLQEHDAPAVAPCMLL